jgi:hypothetical protein
MPWRMSRLGAEGPVMYRNPAKFPHDTPPNTRGDRHKLLPGWSVVPTSDVERGRAACGNDHDLPKPRRAFARRPLEPPATRSVGQTTCPSTTSPRPRLPPATGNAIEARRPLRADNVSKCPMFCVPMGHLSRYCSFFPSYGIARPCLITQPLSDLLKIHAVPVRKTLHEFSRKRRPGDR